MLHLNTEEKVLLIKQCLKGLRAVFLMLLGLMLYQIMMKLDMVDHKTATKKKSNWYVLHLRPSTANSTYVVSESV